MSVITNRTSHRLSIGTDIGDLKLPWAAYNHLRFFHWIRWLCWPITSQWLKVDV